MIAPAVTVMEDLSTTNYVCALFRRSALTIMHWRRFEGMPYVRIPGDGRDSIRYREREVRDWSRRTGRRLYIVEAESNEDGS